MSSNPLSRFAVIVSGVGVAAGDEPEHGVAVVDGQDEPVAEPVDESAGAGGGGEPDGEQLVVVDAAPAQVVDQVGPARGCVPGACGGGVGA